MPAEKPLDLRQVEALERIATSIEKIATVVCPALSKTTQPHLMVTQEVHR